MNVIGHGADGKEFMPVILYDSGNVFFQVIFPGFHNQCIPVFDCKNQVEITLCIGVCHDIEYFSAQRLFDSLIFCFYKYYGALHPSGCFFYLFCHKPTAQS
jgi:hypothetical protein